MTTERALAATMLAAVVLTACANETDAEETAVGRTRAAIVGGAASGAEDDAVIDIAIRPNGKLREVCSGTLVAPNVVLTARHCVSIVDPTIQCNADGVAEQGGTVDGDYAPADLHLYVGGSAVKDAVADGNASTHAAAKGAQIVTDHAKTYCNADVALIVLDRDVDGTYAPLRLDPPAEGDTLTAVGFGITESGARPDVRQRRDVGVVKVGPWAPKPDAGLGDAELLVGEGPCNGDSGGPLFDASHAVVAVASHVVGGDGTGPAGACVGAKAFAFYDLVGKKKALVDEAFAAAGRTPWIEGQPSPFATRSADGPPSSTAAADPGAAPAPAPPPPPPEAQSGCAASPRAPLDGAFAFLALLVAATLAARRRR